MVILLVTAVDVPLVDLELLPDVALLAQDELVQQAELVGVSVGSHSLSDCLEQFGVGEAGFEVSVRVLEAV